MTHATVHVPNTGEVWHVTLHTPPPQWMPPLDGMTFVVKEDGTTAYVPDEWVIVAPEPAAYLSAAARAYLAADATAASVMCALLGIGSELRRTTPTLLAAPLLDVDRIASALAEFDIIAYPPPL